MHHLCVCVCVCVCVCAGQCKHHSLPLKPVYVREFEGVLQRKGNQTTGMLVSYNG